MLAELLLVLSGHPSAFFIPNPSPPLAPMSLQVSPELSTYLHPGEVSSLTALMDLAFRYSFIRRWASDIQRLAREAVLRQSLHTSRKGKNREVLPATPKEEAPNQYLSTLAGAVLSVLKEYEVLIVEVEARILRLDPELVQDSSVGYVPLSSIVATFSPWQAPLAALHHMVQTLSSPPPPTSSEGRTWTPGRILDLVAELCDTGNPSLRRIFTTLLASIRHLFLTHLVVFLLHGVTVPSGLAATASLGLDVGADSLAPQHRVFKLDEELLPSSVKSGTRESILYVGRVAATLRREGRSLPEGLVGGLRNEVMLVQSLEDSGLDEAAQRARAEVGEWLWKHILTGPQVVEALEAFGNYFLHRNGDYATQVIREITRLRLEKITTSNPHSSSSVIREQDLNLALLRASVGTSAETDRSVEKLRWKLEQGPLRPLIPSLTPKRRTADNPYKDDDSIRDLFSSSLLGTPLILETTVSWPLDLFMTPPAIAAYTDVHAYLTAFRDTHLRVLDCWTSLSAAQRQRRKWTGTTEGGAAEEIVERRNLARAAWGTVRLMLFLLDELQSHFMTDIIDVQHRRLLEQLSNVGSPLNSSSSAPSLRGLTARPSSPSVRTRPSTAFAPSIVTDPARSPSLGSSTHVDALTVRSRVAPTPSRPQTTFLDFMTLRQMHSRHLSFLREGLLLADRGVAVLVRDILEVCKRFTGLVERWGGDVLPELLVDGTSGETPGGMVRERAQTVREINESMHDLLEDFFRALVESQNPTTEKMDTSSAGTGAGGTSFSRTARAAQLSRVLSRGTSFTGISGKKGTAGKSKEAIEMEERAMEAEALMGRHVDQLLLRLDFNGVLTQWMSEEEDRAASHDVLKEGGL